MKKKILVLGGNGFVGKNLIDELLKTKKFKVFASLYKNKKKYSKEVKYYHVDLRNFENCKKVTKNKDIVFMCAAISSGASDIQNNPLVHFKNNIFMNLNVLDAATKNNVRKIVFLSSNTVYPPTKRKMKETDVNYNFFSKYFIVGWMKVFSEISSKIFSEYNNSKSKILIVRPANLYGPMDKFDDEKSKVIPSLIKKFKKHALKKKNINIWGDGKDIKDFMYIKDFVSNLIRVSLKFKSNDVINLASGKSVSLKKIIFILKKYFDVNKKYIKFKKNMPKMIPMRKISVEKFKKKYGLKIQYNLKQGLFNTIKWYIKNDHKQNSL